MLDYAVLVAFFEKALAEKWGYILGSAGQICDKALIKYSIDRWPENTATLQYGAQWLGRPVSDCSGMFARCYKDNGLDIPHGSNSIWDGHLSEKGILTSDVDLPPSAAVFKRKANKKYADGWDYYHIGLYIGGGKVIEAKGTRWGVVMSDLKEWDTWGLLKCVKYPNQTGVVVMPILFKAEVKTSGGILNLRDAPDGRDIGDIPNGAVVDVLEETTAAWWKVTYSGKVGWSHTDFLTRLNSAGGDDAVCVSMPRSVWEALRDNINAAIS